MARFLLCFVAACAAQARIRTTTGETARARSTCLRVRALPESACMEGRSVVAGRSGVADLADCLFVCRRSSALIHGDLVVSVSLSIGVCGLAGDRV